MIWDTMKLMWLHCNVYSFQVLPRNTTASSAMEPNYCMLTLRPPCPKLPSSHARYGLEKHFKTDWKFERKIFTIKGYQFYWWFKKIDMLSVYKSWNYPTLALVLQCSIYLVNPVRGDHMNSVRVHIRIRHCDDYCFSCQKHLSLILNIWDKVWV